jgi:hypothetical protein
MAKFRNEVGATRRAPFGSLNRVRNPFSRSGERPRTRKPDPWVAGSREGGLSAEEEQRLEADDLAELLAATNAKRAARGKRAVSQSDVELRVWSLEQETRRAAQVEPAPETRAEAIDPDNPWGD